jgi:hypothetical protein
METRRAYLMKLAALAAAPLAAPLFSQTAEELFRRNIGSPINSTSSSHRTK